VIAGTKRDTQHNRGLQCGLLLLHDPSMLQNSALQACCKQAPAKPMSLFAAQDDQLLINEFNELTRAMR
jgi:hypothetical protein